MNQDKAHSLPTLHFPDSGAAATTVDMIRSSEDHDLRRPGTFAQQISQPLCQLDLLQTLLHGADLRNRGCVSNWGFLDLGNEFDGRSRWIDRSNFQKRLQLRQIHFELFHRGSGDRSNG